MLLRKEIDVTNGVSWERGRREVVSYWLCIPGRLHRWLCCWLPRRLACREQHSMNCVAYGSVLVGCIVMLGCHQWIVERKVSEVETDHRSYTKKRVMFLPVGRRIGWVDGWLEGLREGRRVGRLIGCRVGCDEGVIIGWRLGCMLGWREGCAVGLLIGCRDGWVEGVVIGWRLGWVEGCLEGWLVGLLMGCFEGWLEGSLEGWDDGCCVGWRLGCRDGWMLGCLVGCLVEKWFNVCRARETFSE